jgi:hypothetical protein
VISSPNDIDVVSDDMVDVEATMEDEVSVTVLAPLILHELNTKQSKISSVKPNFARLFIVSSLKFLKSPFNYF